MYDGKCFRVDFDRVTGRVGVLNMLLSMKEAPIIFVLETQWCLVIVEEIE